MNTYFPDWLILIFTYFIFFGPGLAGASLTSIQRPLSHQFPPVARVKQIFSWTFSEHTYNLTSDPGINNTTLIYAAFDLPPWLGFTGSNRSFTGFPDTTDVGLYTVQITATASDGQSSTNDYIQFAVSDKSGNLTLADPVSSQLVIDSSTITSAFPYTSNSTFYPGVRVPPGWSFSLGFQSWTFTAPSRVYYSATLVDGSPLPYWLQFNNNTVTFDGVTPYSPPGIPTPVYQIVISGSDVFGYADLQQSFNITIAAHDFSVVSTIPTMNLTTGSSLNATLAPVLQSINVDGASIKSSDIINATLDHSAFAWLSFNSHNLSLSGVPPTSLNNKSNNTLALSLTDKYGDILNTNVTLAFYPSIFGMNQVAPPVGAPGTFVAVPIFPYLSNASSDPSTISIATLDPQRANSWLSYNAGNNSLNGLIPSDVDYDSVLVHLQGVDTITHAWSHADLTISLAPNGTTNDHRMSSGGLGRGSKIALGVMGGLIGGCVLLCLLLACCRKYVSGKERQLEDQERGENVWWANGQGEYSESESKEKLEDHAETDSEIDLGDEPPHGTVVINPDIRDGSNEKARPTLANLFVGPFRVDSPHPAAGTDGKGSTNSKKLFGFTNLSLGGGGGGGSAKSKTKTLLRRISGRPVISNPIINPSLDNAAFQAQLAAAVDATGIIQRGGTTYHDYRTTSAAGTHVDHDQGTPNQDHRAGSSSNSVTMTVTDDSQFNGHSSRASWESEPPFVWTTQITPGSFAGKRDSNGQESGSAVSDDSHETGSMTSSISTTISQSNVPVQRADFRPSPPSKQGNSHPTVTGSADSDQEISIDNIHFPTDSDLAHGSVSEGGSDKDIAIITTASRVETRRATLESPSSLASGSGSSHSGSYSNSPASSHTERGGTSRLVEVGHQQRVVVNPPRELVGKGGSRSVSQTAEIVNSRSSTSISSKSSSKQSNIPPVPVPVPGSDQYKSVPKARVSTPSPPPASFPSLPALPTGSTGKSKSPSKPTPPSSKQQPPSQRILLGVAESFHFYIPQFDQSSPSPSPSTMTSTTTTTNTTTSTKPRPKKDATYAAFVLKTGWAGRGERLESLPGWLKFDNTELEFYGVPTSGDVGSWEVRVLERYENEERVVGALNLEVVGR